MTKRLPPAPLSPEEIVRIWELGEGRASWSRALLLLGPAHPKVPPDELAEWSVGFRNAKLLDLHRALVGPELASLVECPSCGQALELPLTIEDFWDGVEASEPDSPQLTLQQGQSEVQLRLWTSRDLAAIDDLKEPQAGALELARRAIVGEGELPQPALGEKDLVEIRERLLELDPLAEMTVTVACADCNSQWVSFFDPVEFLWSFVSATAQQLLQEVCAISRAFGWQEEAILAMPAVRRRFYLQVAG